MEDLRTCKVCEETKPITDFQLRGNGRYPYRLHTCDPCQQAKDRERQRRYMAKNRKAHNRRARLDKQIRYEKDPEFREKAKERSRQYYQENREKILAQKRRKRAAAKESSCSPSIKSD